MKSTWLVIFSFFHLSYTNNIFLLYLAVREAAIQKPVGRGAGAFVDAELGGTDGGEECHFSSQTGVEHSRSVEN
jgi:hypothetical protein